VSTDGSVGAVGERALIDRIRARIPDLPPDAVGPGDDAAVLAPVGPRMLYALDTLVEGVDFDLELCSGADVGWKAMAVNASDIGAMGGSPAYALASLCLPSDTRIEVADELIDGLLEAGRCWDISLVGGDISEGPVVVVSLALIGYGSAPVLRSGVRSGHALCVTGALGGAAGGLLSLRARPTARHLDPAERRLRSRQLRPRAEVDAGRALASTAQAMIDISDGLAVDLANLLDAGGLGCVIDPAAVPVDPDLAALRDEEGRPVDAFHLALTGGEDFELLVALEEEDVSRAARAVRAAGATLTRIGVARTGSRLIGERDLDDYRRLGWEHLRKR
jgi:thiamine-monophosphate kinase